jgi:hypothetical protein
LKNRIKAIDDTFASRIIDRQSGHVEALVET